MKRPLFISLGAAAALAATAVAATGPANPSAWVPEPAAGGAFVVGKFAPRTVGPGGPSEPARSDTPSPSPRTLPTAPSFTPRPTELAAPAVVRAEAPSVTPAPTRTPQLAPQLEPAPTRPSEVPKPPQPGQRTTIPTSDTSPTKPVPTKTPVKTPPVAEEKPRNTIVDAGGSR